MTLRKIFFQLFLLTLVISMLRQPVNGLSVDVLPVTAQSQDQIRLSAVDVSILPEFSRPSVLVVYEIELPTDAALPLEMIFQVPDDAQVLTVANREQDNQLNILDNEVTPLGNWKDIRFTSQTGKIRIEYYDPNLVKDGNLRKFEFQWLSVYPVDSFTILVRQPYGASDIAAVPAIGERIEADTPYEYYLSDQGALAAGEMYTLSLSYTKDTGNPTFSALVVEPAAQVDDTTPGRTPPLLSIFIWLVVVGAVMLIFVGIYYMWFRSNVMNQRDRVVQGVGITNPEKQVIFCHECGMRSRLGDTYCSNCGTELRTPTAFDGAVPY